MTFRNPPPRPDAPRPYQHSKQDRVSRPEAMQLEHPETRFIEMVEGSRISSERKDLSLPQMTPDEFVRWRSLKSANEAAYASPATPVAPKKPQIEIFTPPEVELEANDSAFFLVKIAGIISLVVLVGLILQEERWIVSALDTHRGTLTALAGFLAGILVSLRYLKKRGQLI